MDEKQNEDLNIKRVRYPRVSEIIGKQTEREMRAIPQDTLNNASYRGTKIHGYCSAYLEGLWIAEIEEEYVPYVDAFKKFADENIKEVLSTNVRLYDDELRFTGEYDCLVILKNREMPFLLDIKTSANVSRSWPIQLAAYNNLIFKDKYHLANLSILHLKKTKAAVVDEEKKITTPAIIKANHIEYESNEIARAWDIFYSALTCYNYFERKED